MSAAEPEAPGVAARAARVGLALLLVVVLARTAWVSDDAQISFRTVLNLHHGWGLRWNVAERVQAFTHPLWLFLLAAAYPVTGELYLTSMALGAAGSLGAAGLVAWGLAPGALSGAAALAVLVSSKAWVDFATSGLENGLSYLLVAALAWGARRARPGSRRDHAAVCLVAGLMALNRLDLVLLALPVVLVASARVGGARAALPGLALGAAPLATWSAFAFFYYGTPLPNTAYAKLGAGIPGDEVLRQGLGYLANSWGRDPVTLGATALCLGLAAARGRTLERALALGSLAYLGYVVKVGGDFMSGRFLTLPLLAALAAAAPVLPRGRGAGALALVALGVGLAASEGPNLTSGADYAARVDPVPRPPQLIADERAYYWDDFGWLAEGRPPYPAPAWPEFEGPAPPEAVRITASIGREGVTFGPRVHFVDYPGLCDPLLARLPARRDTFQRVGHAERLLPAGYLGALFEGHARLADPALAAYYTKLVAVTRGPLWSWARLEAAGRLLLGYEDHLIDPRPLLRARYPAPLGAIEARPLPAEEAWGPQEDGAPTRAPGALRFDAALDLGLDAPRLGVRWLDASLEADDTYLVRWFLGDEELGVSEVQLTPQGPPGTWNRLQGMAPPAARDRGFDRLRVQLLARGEDGRGAVGHLHLRP